MYPLSPFDWPSYNHYHNINITVGFAIIPIKINYHSASAVHLSVEHGKALGRFRASHHSSTSHG